MVLTPCGAPDPALAIAGSRAGALGILNLEFARDLEAVAAGLASLAEHGRGRLGVLLDGAAGADWVWAILARPIALELVILTASAPERLQALIKLAHDRGCRAGLVATSLKEALAGRDAGADLVIAKGHEAAGWVGEETAFVLLQRLIKNVRLPIWVHGGVGLHTAAACAAAGASGAVLDSQLLLSRESPLPDEVRARLAAIDGSETLCLGGSFGAAFRAYARPGLAVVAETRQLEAHAHAEPASEVRAAWRAAVRGRVGWGRPEDQLLALGQDAAFAPGLAKRFRTVGGVVAALRQSVTDHILDAQRSRPLEQGSALAQSHATCYPIVQGPMTRVSDRAEFAAQVAGAGALPFLALALMRAPEIAVLLEQTRRQLGDRPWGVGILGFVPAELRSEQLQAIRAVRPPFALIAGGRPDQARALELDGIPTYLHVPSPGLLRMFLQEGARRFVFEGRECGGHVGPRTSFVLWESAIQVLEEHLAAGHSACDYHVLFAGGIHDALSAAMISAMAASLAARGMRVGVLIGTAYLFTEEAVRSGAILLGFQKAAIGCERTALLESGPGHATRCAPSPFVESFAEEKRRLVQSGLSPEELRHRLEELNIGRLRIASKGQDRHPEYGREPGAPKLIDLDEREQWSRGMFMIGQVAALRAGTCTMAELHEEISAGAVRHLAGLEPPAPSAEPAPDPAAVAIVGIACILPGAPDIRTLWANICNKVDAITEIPTERWDPRYYFDTDPTARDKVYSRWGGFIDDVAFDPVAFGMPPNALRSIEPFQLLALSVVRAAIDDAGYRDRPFSRDRTAVILGAGGGGADLSSGYMVRSNLPNLLGAGAAEVMDRLGDRLPEWTEDSFAGILMNVAAGRVANRFNLGGVNYTVDAACASSLAAVYLAVRDLEARTSDMVIVGGVDALQNPFSFLCFSKTGALSPNGRCRTFDAEGDGIAISEGFAALVLKRLADAERDGDRIYAVIRGVGGASDGRDRSLTAPRPEGQVRALGRAYAQAGFSPATVGLIEAHGTGTVAGDQAEAQALSTYFGEFGATPESCAIGSIKSMIGHTKATAGVAGLIKAALALYYQVLPPTLGVTRPNPKAIDPEGPFYVNTETRPWVHGDAHPRRAGVSAFGFGGTNFHVVAEEYTRSVRRDECGPIDPWPAELLVWRGQDHAAIRASVVSIAEALAQGARPRLADLAHTLAHHAEPIAPGGPALAIVATSHDDLAEKLNRARAILEAPGDSAHDARGVHYSSKPLAREGKIALLFPGQGSQYVNMCREIAVQFAEARESFARADRALAGRRQRPLSQSIFPPPAFCDEDRQRQQSALAQTDVAQPALGAAGMALFLVLRALGVEPGMAAGHSYGELVALCAAGCFREDDLACLSESRGRFILECAKDDPGAMLAVEAGVDDLQPLVTGTGLTLANMNSPRQTVISGSRAEIEQAVAWCKGRGQAARLLPVSCAFHSPLVAQAQRRLVDVLSELALSPPRIPVFSNTTAGLYPECPREIASLLGEHLVRPVQFIAEIEAMHAAGARVFVEAGPRSVLSGLVGQILHGRPHVCVALDQPDRHGLVQLLHGLARLIVEGVPIRLGRLYRGRAVRLLDLKNLEKETGEPAHSPTTWLVNGGRARPLAAQAAPNEPSKPESPPAPKTRAAIAPAATRRNGSRTPVVAPGSSSRKLARFSPELDGRKPQPAAARTRSFEVIPRHQGPTTHQGEPIPMQNGSQSLRVNGSRVMPPASAGEHAADMLRQFQHVMQCFLRTQEVVMHDMTVAFLGAQNGASVALDHELRGMQPGPLHLGVGPPREWAEWTAPPPADPDSASNGVHQNGHQAIAARPPAAPLAEKEAAEEEVALEEERPGPVAPAPTATFDSQTLTDRLLAVVSERTGYPTDMLSLDADLEADLGIDSIKRVEISGTFLRSLDLPPDHTPDIERLTGSRTLRQVIENLASLIAAPGGADAWLHQQEAETGFSTQSPERDRVPFDPARTGSGIGRFALQAVVAPPVGQPGGLSRAGAVVVIDDETGVGERLAAWLGARGHRVVRVVQGVGAPAAPGLITGACLDNPDEVTRLVAELHASHGPAVALIHLVALRPGAATMGFDPDRWTRRLAEGVKSLLLLTQALQQDLVRAAADGGAAVLAATGLGGTFAVGDCASSCFPGHGAIAGFLKTLDQEWPAVRVKCVDVSPASPELAASWLGAELLADDGRVEVGYRDGQRSLLELVAAPLGSEQGAQPLDRDSVVLVTGGARGITAEAALRLAHAYRPTLVLVGRTSLPDGPEAAETAHLAEPQAIKRALIDQLRRADAPVTPALVEQSYRRLMQERQLRENHARFEQSGARVEYRPCDVRDPAAFGVLIDDVYRAHGRIDGVIHGAGVIEDQLIQNKRLDSFDRVLETKVHSALVLAAKLRPESLRFLVFFSSVSGRFGNRGQADYAAASEVLNKLAQDLDRRWPGRVVSMNWGPWLATGMVTPEVERQFAERGVELIPPEVGCRMLDEELRAPAHEAQAEVTIGGGRGLGRPLPLLAGCPVMRHRDGSVEVARTLDLERDRYLQDHRLEGRPVLPFAMALELMAEVAAAGWPDREVIAARQVRLLRGISLDGNTLPLCVVARPRSESLIDVNITSESDPKQVHYRAEIELGRLADAPAGCAEPGVLERAGPLSIGVEGAYREWLFHGPLFQGIASIEAIGPKGARARLEPAPLAACLAGAAQGQWLFDPVAVDCALQVQVIWTRLHWGVTLLPSRAAEFRRFGPIGGEPRVMRHELRITPECQAPLSHANHWFYDPDGRLLATITNMEGTGTKALNRLAAAGGTQ
jgi:acyl transferase domain-containing protein/NAD(P)H-dependent flavin oxidoreductase YrpB (nitropropane dioxygenase family)